MAEEKPAVMDLRSVFESVAGNGGHDNGTTLMTRGLDESNLGSLPETLLYKIGFTDSEIAQLKAKRESNEVLGWFWWAALRQSIRKINQIIEDLHRRMDELLESIAMEQEELAGLDRKHEILDAELKYFQKHGCFDLDEHRRLRNQEAEAILAAWEKETGQKIDRTDPASYEIIFRILMGIEQQRIALQESLDTDIAEYEHCKKQLEEAEEIRDGLQSDNESENRKALAEFEDFFDDYQTTFEGPNVKKEVADPENDTLLLDGLDELPVNLGDDFSYGFEPINEAFTKSSSGQGESTSLNSENTDRRLNPFHNMVPNGR